MNDYKVICRIDKGEGIIDYPLYIRKVKDEAEAENTAKRYVLGTMNVPFYGAKTITKM
jgi:hypothetical protein